MPSVPETMRRLLEILNDIPRPGEHVFLVGGCVRDILLGRPTKDVDLITDGNPRWLAGQIARRTHGSPFALRSEMRVYRVMPRRGQEGIPVDVLPFTETLDDDLRRRDFTINAMALAVPVDPDHPDRQVVDPTGGVADLGARRIRHVAPDVFASDPVRLLRGVRIAAALGFDIDPDTEALMRAQAPLLVQPAIERVRDEFFCLLGVTESAAWVGRMDSLGLLSPVLPEVDALRGVEQNANHHLDAWAHTLEALRQCDRLLAGDELPEDVSDLARRELAEDACPPRTRAQLFRLAAILHDIAKPQTRGETPDGIVTFWGHDEAGAEVARAIGDRLRLSGRETKRVATAVLGHLRAGFLSCEEPLPALKRYHFFRDMGDAAVETLLLSLADRLAARGPWAKPEQIERHRAFVAEMLRLYFARDRVAHPVVPVDGRALMRATRVRKGPELGALVDALKEAVAVGDVSTPEEAVAFARAWVAGGVSVRDPG